MEEARICLHEGSLNHRIRIVKINQAGQSSRHISLFGAGKLSRQPDEPARMRRVFEGNPVTSPGFDLLWDIPWTMRVDFHPVWKSRGVHRAGRFLRQDREDRPASCLGRAGFLWRCPGRRTRATRKSASPRPAHLAAGCAVAGPMAADGAGGGPRAGLDRRAAGGGWLVSTYPSGQPAVTSLSAMAFLSRGHQPGVGPYGACIDRAVDFVMSCQKEDGLFCYQVPQAVYLTREASHTASYNHAIAGLMLTEVYGQVAGRRAEAVKAAIGRALLFTRALQARPKPEPDKGGWRYLRLSTSTGGDSDISATAWQLMFLRSAKNAEFDVPPEPIEQAMSYVNRCWNPSSGMFNYAFQNGVPYGASRGVTGAGIVSLAMGGQHQTPIALGGRGLVVGASFPKFRRSDRALRQVYLRHLLLQPGGGATGRALLAGNLSPMVEVLLSSQSPDGSWKSAPDLATFGDGFMTAMAVLSLTPAYQLLPVYQR